MWKILPYAILQSLLLTAAQVCLKYAMMRMPAFAWNRLFWREALTNWQFAASGILFAAASLMWMYIVRHFPFSTAYPMVSLSYVLGMVAAVTCFHEQVSAVKWMGTAFIVIGCLMIAR